MPPSPRLAIVGAGVRGTALLGRIVAHAASATPHVTVWDPFPAGSGRIWRADQSHLLLMNTVAGQSTVFADERSGVTGAPVPGPDMAQWAADVAAGRVSVDLPDDLRSEAENTVPHSHPSRALYGAYLRWAFNNLTERARDRGITVDVRRTTVVDARPGWTLTDSAGATTEHDAVILALGWTRRADVPRGPRIVSPDSPIDQDLHAVAAGDTVIVRGLGMNFFDVATLLTQGRGGRITAGRYVPSGNEPVLWAGSRRGMPFRAKPVFAAVPPVPAQRLLRAGIPDRRPIDFATELLPLIEADAHWDYAETLERMRPGSVDVASFTADLASGVDPREAIARHFAPDAPRLDLAAATDPLRGRSTDLDAAVRAAVADDLDQARLGADSPLKMALHSYQAARAVLAPLARFGGFTAASRAAHRAFSEAATSFGSGPPAIRSAELLALHDAGIVRFLGPDVRIDVETHVTATSARGDVVRADRLIEAWLPIPSVSAFAEELPRSLLAAGLGRSAEAHGAPHSIEVRDDDCAVLDAQGVAVPGLFSLGVPHDDLRRAQIIAPMPRTPSAVLRDLDVAVIAALGVGVLSETP